jgi:ABC-type transport system involved in multi-copper enzyme maturation permease subunit
MSKFMAVMGDSILEVRDRKIFYLYWAVTLVMLLVFALVPNLKVDGNDLFGSMASSPETIMQVQSAFFGGYFGFMLFLMVFGSAALVPSFLNKGRVELTLSKPISRYRLLSMKFLSVFIIMCGILIVSCTILWGVLSFRLGVTSGYFFYGLLYACLEFLAIYAIVFFLGAVAQSTVVAIMGYFIIRVGSDLLANREVVYQFLGDSIWKTILDTAYHILPKIGEMSDNFGSLMKGSGFVHTYPIYSTLGISLVIFLISLLIFRHRDY